MMTPLKWWLLCGLLILYLLIGGGMFMAIEQAHEMQQNEDFSVLKKDVREILLRLDRQYYQNGTSPAILEAIEAAKESVIHRISESCGGHNLLDESDEPTELRWSYYNSVFFAFTAVTTIGYGNLSPTTYWSRVLTMIYALFGIPINGILISGLSKYFASKLINVHRRSKDKMHGNRLSFVFDIAFYLIPGLLVFIVVPAGFFVVIEGWPYLDAIYFSFITLTTIGFGDYVAGMGDGHSVWLWIYKICMIIWIIFGLGYFVMILSFITKGMTHKKVRTVINKRLSKIKNTKDKLIQDIDYLRRVVNELYMMKIRPIYNDEDGDGGFDNDACSVISGEKYQVYDRSISQPHIFRRSNLSLDLQSMERIKKESVTHVRRRCSETDLDRIDRERTFEEALKHAVLPEELLATVITALADNIHSDDDPSEENVTTEHDEDYESEETDETGEDFISEVTAEHVPPWELGLLHESDEEILLDDEPSSILQEVVVQSAPAAISKPSAKTSNLNTPQLIHRKVSEMIRKISAGHKETTNEEKKISRTESERSSKKKISYDPDGRPGGEYLKKNLAQSPIAPVHKTSKDHSKEVSRKISQESSSNRNRKISRDKDRAATTKQSGSSRSSPRISREHSPVMGGHAHGGPGYHGPNRQQPHHRPHNVWELDKRMRRSGRSSPQHFFLNQMAPMMDFSSSPKSPTRLHPSSANSSCGNSRKISRESQFDYSTQNSDSGYELDHTTLSDLLRALDSVHGRLKRCNSKDTEKDKKISNASSVPSSYVPVNSNMTMVSYNHSEGTNSSTSQVNSNHVHHMAAPTNTSTSTATASTASNLSKSPRLKRRRKIGVFNPDFIYTPSFQEEVNGNCGNGNNNNEVKRVQGETKIGKDESEA